MCYAVIDMSAVSDLGVSVLCAMATIRCMTEWLRKISFDAQPTYYK